MAEHLTWDERYRRGEHADLDPSPLLIRAAALVPAEPGPLPPRRALDLACGAGRHALWLAQNGWNVSAVDRSEAALQILRERAAGLNLAGEIEMVAADLEAGYKIPNEQYGLICDFLYLDRALFPAIRAGLRTGGIAVVEVRSSGSWKVAPEELPGHFAGWEIVHHAEDGVTAQLIARKPAELKQV